MAKNLRQALAQRQAERVDFDVSPVLARPGRRTMPGALLVERRFLLPDPDQPRKAFDEARLQDLADSLRQVGILQPLRVRTAEEEGFYFIVNGERRWRAAGLADVNEVPVVVRDSPADVRAFEMLVENLQRENLSDEEEAQAYRTLNDQGYGVNEIARRLGISAGRVSKNLRIVEDEALFGAIQRQVLTKGQVQEILPLDREDRQGIVEEVARRREAGQQITADVVRRAVKARQAEVMESVSARNTFHKEELPAAEANPRKTIDIAVRHLIEQIYSLPGRYPGAAMSPRVGDELDAALRALAEWRGRNGAAG